MLLRAALRRGPPCGGPCCGPPYGAPGGGPCGPPCCGPDQPGGGCCPGGGPPQPGPGCCHPPPDWGPCAWNSCAPPVISRNASSSVASLVATARAAGSGSRRPGRRPRRAVRPITLSSPGPAACTEPSPASRCPISAARSRACGRAHQHGVERALPGEVARPGRWRSSGRGRSRPARRPSAPSRRAGGWRRTPTAPRRRAP